MPFFLRTMHMKYDPPPTPPPHPHPLPPHNPLPSPPQKASLSFTNDEHVQRAHKSRGGLIENEKPITNCVPPEAAGRVRSDDICHPAAMFLQGDRMLTADLADDRGYTFSGVDVPCILLDMPGASCRRRLRSLLWCLLCESFGC